MNVSREQSPARTPLSPKMVNIVELNLSTKKGLDVKQPFQSPTSKVRSSSQSSRHTKQENLSRTSPSPGKKVQKILTTVNLPRADVERSQGHLTREKILSNSSTLQGSNPQTNISIPM